MEKDENECITELGYFFNEELGACVRFSDIPEEDKTALKAAVQYVGEPAGLRIRKYLYTPCDTCYKVKMAVDDGYFSVRLKDGEVVDYFDEEELGIGTKIGSYTTVAELVRSLLINIMSTNASQLEKIDVVWSAGIEEYALGGIGNWVEGEYRSGDITSMHKDVMDSLKEIGFTTDDSNIRSGSEDYDLQVVSYRDAVCNVLLEGDQVQNTSKLQVACAEY